MRVEDMLVARQRVADQDRVGPVGVELAIGLVGDLERCEIDAAIELQRLIGAKARDKRRWMIGFMQSLIRMDRRTDAHFPKFVNHCVVLPHELREAMGISKITIAVPLFDLKFLNSARGKFRRNFKSATLLTDVTLTISSQSAFADCSRTAM
jgi:hypothetical protein